MTRDSVLRTTLKRITPTPKERKEMQSVLDKIVHATDRILKPLRLAHVLAGSYTRDTWMKDKKEFDIFILFPETTQRDRLEKQGLDVGQKIVKSLGGSYKIAYAEHPYTRGTVEGYDIDIVPCFNVRSAFNIKSAVDRTPFHNRWVSQHLDPKKSGEVRLLKQFLRANGLYGSDLKVQGFSGYLSELLIIHYGSFKELVKKASRWEPGHTIDIMEHIDEKSQERHKGQPLIVIDPVDPKRNVAAALSPENFTKFIYLSRSFFRKPSMLHFFKPAYKPNYKKIQSLIKKRQTQFLAVKFKKPEVIDDVLWPQLRKTAVRLTNILREYEFIAINSEVFSDGVALILLELEVWELPSLRKIRGPPINARKNAEQFKKKYKKTARLYVERNYWVAETEREFTKADAKLRDSLSSKKSELKAKGIASYVAEALSKGFMLLHEKQILDLAKKENLFAEFLENYLKKDLK